MLRMELHARLRSVCCALLFVHSMREISSCTGDDEYHARRPPPLFPLLCVSRVTGWNLVQVWDGSRVL